MAVEASPYFNEADRVLSRQASRIVAAVLAVVLTCEVGIAVYMLIVVWPAALDIASQAASTSIQPPSVPTVSLFGGRWATSAEQMNLLLVLGGGALGSGIALSSSLAEYIGNRRLIASWIPWYFIRMPIGVALPLVIYGAVRGGLLNVSASGSALNPYAVVAISAIVGMFSNQIIERLRAAMDKATAIEAPHNFYVPPRPDNIEAGGSEGEARDA